MITFLLLIVACFLTGLLTLITGFGLGTVLTPFFTLLYDVKIALFLVAIIHFSNNLFKFYLFHSHLNQPIFKRFGLVSFIGAVVGASLFGLIPTQWLRHLFGGFLIWSGLAELSAKKGKKQIPKKWELGGGFLSGLLGGLIGSQGAVRSAYLLNYPLEKEAFIATGTAISILVDLSRIPIYIYSEKAMFAELNPWFVALLLAAAFAGTHMGKKTIQHLSGKSFRRIVAISLVIIGIYLFF